MVTIPIQLMVGLLLVWGAPAGLDWLAMLFTTSRELVIVNHIVLTGSTPPSPSAIRRLRAYVIALEGHRARSLLVLAETAPEASRPLLETGAVIEVICVPFVYRVVSLGTGTWGIATVPGWLGWLAREPSEHAEHAPTKLLPDAS